MPKPLAALVVFVLACATTSPTQRATAAAVATKALTETAYGPWDAYVAAATERCQRELPPAEHKRSEFDACLGPAIEHERAVVPALEAYHAAALALYVALTRGDDDAEIDAARRELARAAVELVRTIPAIDETIKRAQRAIGG